MVDWSFSAILRHFLRKSARHSGFQDPDMTCRQFYRGLSPPSFLFQVRGHGSRVILPCCNQSNQSVSRLISVPAAVKVDQEESVEFCDSHSSSAPFEPNVIWRLHTNPRRGKRLYQLFMVKIRYIRKFASPKLMTVGQLVNELGAGKIEPGWLIPHRS